MVKVPEARVFFVSLKILKRPKWLDRNELGTLAEVKKRAVAGEPIGECPQGHGTKLGFSISSLINQRHLFWDKHCMIKSQNTNTLKVSTRSKWNYKIEKKQNSKVNCFLLLFLKLTTNLRTKAIGKFRPKQF